MSNVKELFNLEGRVSVVTGGATGLGLQMATALAEAGSSIVVCSRQLENCEQAARDIEKTGVRALGVACDVTRPGEVEAMKDATLAKFGRVDILVNNAGRAWVAPPEELPLERWNEYVFWAPPGRPMAEVRLPDELFGFQTYRSRGLPPTPISGVGVASLEAALEPQENPYLYYVLDPSCDGSHVFAETLEPRMKRWVTLDPVAVDRNGAVVVHRVGIVDRDDGRAVDDRGHVPSPLARSPIRIGPCNTPTRSPIEWPTQQRPTRPVRFR